jgi:hypothetical protein
VRHTFPHLNCFSQFPQAAELLKDKAGWLRGCRRCEVLGGFTAAGSGRVDLLYTQVREHRPHTPANRKPSHPHTASSHSHRASGRCLCTLTASNTTQQLHPVLLLVHCSRGPCKAADSVLPPAGMQSCSVGDHL